MADQEFYTIKIKDLQSVEGDYPFDRFVPCDDGASKIHIQNVWEMDEEITIEAVTEACLQGHPSNPEPFNPYNRWGKDRENYLNRYDHIGRIKWFMENRNWEPIELDVGIPSLGYIPYNIIQDGWHRYAAALVLGLETIDVVYSGSVTAFEMLFNQNQTDASA